MCQPPLPCARRACRGKSPGPWSSHHGASWLLIGLLMEQEGLAPKLLLGTIKDLRLIPLGRKEQQRNLASSVRGQVAGCRGDVCKAGMPEQAPQRDPVWRGTRFPAKRLTSPWSHVGGIQPHWFMMQAKQTGVSMLRLKILRDVSLPPFAANQNDAMLLPKKG